MAEKTTIPLYPESPASLAGSHQSLLFSITVAIGALMIFSAGTSVCCAAAKPFKVFTKREGNITRFFVENLEAAEITATFEMDLENLTGTNKFPYTATFPAGKVTEAFSLWPANPEGSWNFSYTTHYTMGSSTAVHDNSYVYWLPFEPGAAYRVTQGYNGSFSHTGPDQYALDFRMPVGTPVHAARGGTIVKAKSDSSVGGSERRYQNSANYILIRHTDGTLANYAHLKKDGSLVKVGQVVEAGDLIGYSGNTGFSSGPHLHFSVFKTRNGSQRQTLPIRFRTSDNAAITLSEGKSYTCPARAVAVVKRPKNPESLADNKPTTAVGTP